MSQVSPFKERDDTEEIIRNNANLGRSPKRRRGKTAFWMRKRISHLPGMASR